MSTGEADDDVREVLSLDPMDPRRGRSRGPDIEDVRRRVSRRRARRRVTAGAMSFVALGVLGYGVVSSIGPDKETVIVGLNDVAAPPDGQEAPDSCPKGPVLEESASRDKLEDMAVEAKELGRAYPGHFSGAGVCSSTGVLSIYRVPGNADLDSAMVEFGQERKVTVVLKDARYSAEDAKKTAEVVKGRYAELARNGVEFSFTSPTGQGYVKVAVVNDVAKAREILSDLGDRIQVIQVERSEPL